MLFKILKFYRNRFESDSFMNLPHTVFRLLSTHPPLPLESATPWSSGKLPLAFWQSVRTLDRADRPSSQEWEYAPNETNVKSLLSHLDPFKREYKTQKRLIRANED